MKRLAHSLALAVFVMFCTSWSCGQNGPTAPTVVLNWTQSTTSGVTGNCVYRGTVTKVYTMPALFCSTAPSVTYTDTTVTRGTTYFYVVTAQLNKIESGYSNEATAPVILVSPPSGNGSTESKLTPPMDKSDGLVLTAKVQWRQGEPSEHH